MQPVSMREDEVELRLEASISGFADRVPLMSARNLVSRGQRNSLIGLLIVIVIGLVFDVRLTFIVIMAFFTLLYLIAVLYRTYLFTRSSKSNALEIVTDEEALSVPDSELPFYTILLPVYNEASVIIKLIDSLGQMDYPAGRLEVLLLVEEDDEETLDALRAADPPCTVQTGRDPSRRTSHQAQGAELRPDAGPGGHRRRLRRRGHARHPPAASSCRCARSVRSRSGVRAGDSCRTATRRRTSSPGGSPWSTPCGSPSSFPAW